MGSANRRLELPTLKMGWRVAVFALLLCGSSQSRPSLLGAADGGDHHHHHEPHQAVDYSYSDYDYQPEEGRSLGAEDEYYEQTLALSSRIPTSSPPLCGKPPTQVQRPQQLVLLMQHHCLLLLLLTPLSSRFQ